MGKIPLIIPIIVSYTFTQVTRDKNNVILLIKIVKIRISINFQKCVQDIYIYIFARIMKICRFGRESSYVITRRITPHAYFRTQYDECNKFNTINNCVLSITRLESFETTKFPYITLL